MSDNPFNITREELLNLAAQKLADQAQDESELIEMANKLVREKVEKALAQSVLASVDKFLADEMEKILSQTICPVDVWGDRTGAPTTLRATLHERAKAYWAENVDGEGKLVTNSWSSSGKPRAEWLMCKVAGKEFEGVVKQNIVNIIGALKDAVRDDMKANVDKYLNELIKVKSQGDQKQ